MGKNLTLPAGVASVEGEQVLERWRANRVQTSNRAVGGHLYVTSCRLVFKAHAFDTALMGVSLQLPLAGISEVGRRPCDFSQIMAGSLRDRLELLLVDGTVELFVVNKLDAVIEKIEACRAEHRPG